MRVDELYKALSKNRCPCYSYKKAIDPEGVDFTKLIRDSVKFQGKYDDLINIKNNRCTPSGIDFKEDVIKFRPPYPITYFELKLDSEQSVGFLLDSRGDKGAQSRAVNIYVFVYVSERWMRVPISYEIVPDHDEKIWECPVSNGDAELKFNSI